MSNDIANNVNKILAHDDKAKKEALKYIRSAYPEIYGDRTVLEIRPYLNDREKAENAERNTVAMPMMYPFQVPPHLRSQDDRVSHYRAITTDGLVMFYEKSENRPANINRWGLKKGEVKTFAIDLSKIQGLYMLAYWIEHPFVKVYGVDNQHLKNPMFEMRIRGNVIKHDFELMDENYAIGNEIRGIVPREDASEEEKKEAQVELVNIAAFLGMDTVGLTQAELLLGMLGLKMDGKAYEERAKYRKYQSLNKDERDIEIAVAKAIEYKFIQDTGAEGWKLDDGTILGADKSQVLNYFREKKAAQNKLMDRVRVHAESKPTISDVEALVAEPSKGVRQTTPQRAKKETVAGEKK